MMKQLSIRQTLRTGSTMRFGFGSPLAALRIISRACLRFSVLFAVIPPSCISARLKALKAGAVVICAIDLEGTVPSPGAT